MEQKIARSNILIPFLEESYRAEHTEYARRNLRFSDAGAGAVEGENCERQIYYDMKIHDKKSKITSGSLVMFDDGHLHEQDIRRRLRLILKSPEKEAYDPETGAKGKLDNTIDYRKVPELDLKEDPVLEIKTANEFSFQHMAATGQISQRYYDQIQYYLFETKKLMAVLLIKNRNSTGPGKGQLSYLEYTVMSDPERQKEIRISLLAVKESVEANVLPARPFPIESTNCSYCRFKYTCWEGIIDKDKAPEPLKEEIPEPSQEMLESAVKVYNRCNLVEKELKKDKEDARKVIEAYFKSKGETELLVGNIKSTYSPVAKTVLDVEFLTEKLSAAQFAMISKPQVKLLEYAVSAREIDAKILEDAKKIEYGRQLRVNEIKKKESARLDKIKEDPSANTNAGKKTKKRLPARGRKTSRKVRSKNTTRNSNRPMGSADSASDGASDGRAS